MGHHAAKLRDEIDRGLTGDRSPALDPAAAPLGTDEEAAGTPVGEEAVQQARAEELRPDISTRSNSPSPALSPQGAASGRSVFSKATWLGIAAILTLIAAGVLLTSSPWAQDDRSEPGISPLSKPEGLPEPYADLSAADYVLKVAEYDRAQIEMGRMAQERATNEDVRALGTEIVQAHTADLASLGAVSSPLGLSVLTPDDGDRQNADVEDLRGGTNFDEAFLKKQAGLHNELSTIHKAVAGGDHPPSIKDYAQQAWPPLQERLARIRAMQVAD